LARLNPVSAIGSALVFGALEAGASAMQRDAQVPAGMVEVVEACVILVLVASEWIGGRGVSTRSFFWGGPPTAASAEASESHSRTRPAEPSSTNTNRSFITLHDTRSSPEVSA
jgi:hypothetical protein